MSCAVLLTRDHDVQEKDQYSVLAVISYYYSFYMDIFPSKVSPLSTENFNGVSSNKIKPNNKE